MEDLVEEIAKNVKIANHNLIEEYPIKNILYSKLASLYSIKGVTFDSVINVNGPTCLSHYALNFIRSGSNKNTTLKLLDKNIFGFEDAEINKINNQIKENYINKKRERLKKQTDEAELEIREEAENLEILTKYITDATPEAMYDNAELISQIKRGSINIKMSEFTQYFARSVDDKFSNNGKFLDILYDSYDGDFNSRKIRNKQRQELHNIATTCILFSDFWNMKQANINKHFKERLKTGYARRFYYYYDPDINYVLNPPEKVSLHDIMKAKNKLSLSSAELKKRFDLIPVNMCYEVSNEVLELLNQWQENYNKPKAPKFYKNGKSYLDINESILETVILSAQWQILKLAVIIHITNNPTKSEISTEAMLDAINFYIESYNYLVNILNDKDISEVQKIANYFISNENNDITKGDLRSLELWNKNIYSSMLDNIYPDLVLYLSQRGYILETFKGLGNAQIYKCRSVKSLITTPINVSIAKLKYDSETPKNFDFQCLDVQDFINMIKQKYAFVPCKLKNGKRKSENNIGSQNTIWLDFDDGKYFEEVKALLKDYNYIAYTSKSHQISKNDKISDRFRIILLTKTLLPSDERQFKIIMKNLINIYGADTACSDRARLYWSNPKSEVFINSGELFDFRPFEKDVEEEFKIVKPFLQEKVTYSVWNDLNDVILTTKGDDILGVNKISKGCRNHELFRISAWLKDLVLNKELEHSIAITKLDDIIFKMDKTDFKNSEIERMRKIVRDLRT